MGMVQGSFGEALSDQIQGVQGRPVVSIAQRLIGQQSAGIGGRMGLIAQGEVLQGQGFEGLDALVGEGVGSHLEGGEGFGASKDGHHLGGGIGPAQRKVADLLEHDGLEVLGREREALLEGDVRVASFDLLAASGAGIDVFALVQDKGVQERQVLFDLVHSLRG